MLVFGDSDSGPAVSVTACDARCMMINLDPETGEKDARVMKTVVRLNQNNAGVYATVVRSGTIRVGNRVIVSEEPAIRYASTAVALQLSARVVKQDGAAI